MLSRDSISQTGQFFNRILPKYSRIPLLFTVVLNFSVYWGARAIAGGFIHHNIETSLDDMIPVVYPTVVIYFGCYIFWIIGYLFYLLCRVSYNQHPPGDSGLRHMGTAHALFI